MQNRQSNQHHGCFISNSLHENVDCEELFQELVVYSLTILMPSPSLSCSSILLLLLLLHGRFEQQIFFFCHFRCMCGVCMCVFIEISKWWDCAKVCDWIVRAIDRWWRKKTRGGAEGKKSRRNRLPILNRFSFGTDERAREWVRVSITHHFINNAYFLSHLWSHQHYFRYIMMSWCVPNRANNFYTIFYCHKMLNEYLIFYNISIIHNKYV